MSDLDQQNWRKVLQTAYRHCEDIAKNHYENFPVASIFLPKKSRRPIAVIYAFARQADDIADEGIFSKEERLALLQAYSLALTECEQGIIPTDPIFIALQDVLKKHALPVSLLFDLLTAFKQDILKHEYENFEEILAYCRYSANPIGRLLLHLTNNATSENLAFSDAICTALQLINFLQDLSSDIRVRARYYLPKNEMVSLNLTKEDFLMQKETKEMKNLIHTQLLRAESLLIKGLPLRQNLKGLFSFELRLIIAGARLMINLLKKRRSIYAQPKIKLIHIPRVLWYSFSRHNKVCHSTFSPLND